LISIEPFTSRPETTVPGVLTAKPPDGASGTPAGTPVFDGSGYPHSLGSGRQLVLPTGGAGDGGGAVGVAELECADAGPVPTVLVAATVKVYAVPFVSPLIVVLVAGGEPATVVGVWAVEPLYGVMV
jgi:hypothetical protein